MSFTKNVNLKDLKSVIVKVPVGRSPKKTIEDTLTKVNQHLRRIFPVEIKIMLIPIFESKDYEFIFLENHDGYMS